MADSAKNFRVVFTGGGTGGHLYPLLAVLEGIYGLAARHKFEFDVWYLGPESPFNKELEAHSIKVWNVISSKYRRYFSLENFIDLPKFFIGFLQAIFKLYFLMPNVVFSKGGPGALPVILAARFYFIPIIIHESDAIPGITNTISARFARKVGISFETATRYFREKDRSKIALVGNPIRGSLLEDAPSQLLAKANLLLDPKEKLVLVWGGSQGSTRINEFIFENLAKILPLAQVLHQVGQRNYEEIKLEMNVILKDIDYYMQKRYHFVNYLEFEELKNALAGADLVISRAGSGAIFEIAAMGKPAILIPLPESASDHQKLNAYEYSQTGAAIVIEEANLLSTLFINQLKGLLESPERLQKMSEAAKQFAKPQAAEILAREIIVISQ